MFILAPILALLAIAVAIALFVFWIAMLISAIQNQGLGEGEKIVWVLVVILLHFLGATLYFFLGRSKGA